MNRILSQHGNVIAADFRPDRLADLTVTFTSETLYCDDHVILTRITATMGGKPIIVLHFAGDLATGKSTNL